MNQTLGTVQDVPQRFRELDGKKVILEGEISPGGTSAGPQTDAVSLCYSVAKCCFTGQPKVQHFVLCSAPAGKTIRNFGAYDAVRVKGTLHVRFKRDAGIIPSIFQLDVEHIEQLT